MGPGLSSIDIAVIFALMAGVTLLGHYLSGHVQDRAGFFQAGGTLPWWAVSASIIATLVSSVTFVSVPAAVFRDGGNLTYFQVILGLAVGKFFIAWLLVRPYYESQGIASTYEYIGARMDKATGEFSMLVGLVLNVINSAVKLLTASLVLDVITAWGLPACGLFVLAFSVLWSVLAGIKTVIWTDFLLFVLFVAGAIFAFLFMIGQIQMTLPQALVWLDDQAKLVLFDFSTDPQTRYSIWACAFGAVGLSIALGSTQGTWQRVRACRSVGDAQKAYNYSALFYLMHIVILGVGLTLAVFYGEHGLPASVAAMLVDTPDRIFPYFIVSEIPVGVSGLFIAAIFAAAISTLDSALAETADVSITHLYQPYLRPNKSERHYLLASRVSLVLWGVVFYLVALFFNQYSAEGLLDLTFKLPNFVYGITFATILLARYGIGHFRGFLTGALVACLLVGLMVVYDVAFFWWCPVSGVAMITVVWLTDRRPIEPNGIVNKPWKSNSVGVG